MLGSMPMMAAPVYQPVYPVENYPIQFSRPPAAWQPAPAAPRAVPSPALVQQPIPRPIIRAKGADDPDEIAPTTPVTLPSPQQLGIAPASRPSGPSTDWAEAHRRLDRLGAVCFQKEKLSQGGFRVTCLLPTARPEVHHRVEAFAATEAEVLRLTLDKAEEWAGGR
jgi:hypothetical protein